VITARTQALVVVALLLGPVAGAGTGWWAGHHYAQIGPQGPQGPAGPTGAAGPTGPAGPAPADPLEPLHHSYVLVRQTAECPDGAHITALRVYGRWLEGEEEFKACLIGGTSFASSD